MKFTKSLSSEITWLITGLVLVVLVCTLLGLSAHVITLYFAGYAIWLLLRLNKMVCWLEKGAKTSEAPETMGLTTDIVQRVHREKKYSRTQKNKYRSTLAQFNSLAADLPDATVVLTENHEIRWANVAARRLLNIQPDRDVGQRVDNLVRTPEFREFLYSGTDHEELEIHSPVAPEIVLAVRLVKTGKNMMVLIAADMTQRVQLREMRKAFVADVSHELRTPLTVIKGYLEMLREDDNIPNDIATILTQISTQSDRMQGIVNDLLRLSRIEGNALAEKEGSIVDVPALISAMIAPLNEMSEHHHIKLHLDPDLGLLGSENEIYSACNNLLTNAVRYTDPGTTIEVSWFKDENGQAAYVVSDDGQGIEARHLARLSERFYRVDAGRSRDSGGTGLGLAIVKHAAQRHGGNLEIQSTPGSGSEFRILFPASRCVILQNNDPATEKTSN